MWKIFVRHCRANRSQVTCEIQSLARPRIRMHSLSVFLFDMRTLNGYAINMKPDELKKIREKMEARQQDLARVLGVPVRTYQNWEQPDGSKAHRRIPTEAADRVYCLFELMKGRQGKRHFPGEIFWQQVPLRREELKDIKHAATLEDKTASVFIREAIIAKLNAPRTVFGSAFDDSDGDDWKEELREMDRQEGKGWLG